MKRTSAPAPGLALCLLAGCAGQSSEGVDTRPGATEIDADNALIVATATMTALASAGDIAAVDDLLGRLADRAAGSIDTAASLRPARAPGSPDKLAMNPCRAGGFNGSVSLGQPHLLRLEQRLAPGDYFSLDFSDCRLTAELSLSGGLDLQVDRFVGALNGGDVEYLYTAMFRNLRVDAAPANYVANGDMQMFFGSTSFPLVFAALSGQHLTIESGRSSATLRDYDLASEGVLLRKPDVYGSINTIFDGFLASTEFAGEIRFQTQTPFRTDGQPRAIPSQGQILIVGAGNAVLRLTVTGEAVQLELDANGNGSFEHRDSASWATLTGGV